MFNSFGFGGLGIVVVLASLVWAIFWMVTGWRAMKAHEGIANALAEIAHQGRSNPLDRS